MDELKEALLKYDLLDKVKRMELEFVNIVVHAAPLTLSSIDEKVEFSIEIIKNLYNKEIWTLEAYLIESPVNLFSFIPPGRFNNINELIKS